MKNRYQRLTKEEKKEAIERYKKADEHNEFMHKKLTQVQIICVIGMLFGVAVIAHTLITHDKWLFVAEYGFLLVFSIALFMFCIRTKDKEYNKFLIEEAKKEKEDNKKEDKKTKKKSK